MNPAREPERTQRFIGWALAVLAVFGFLIRLRIQRGSALPSSDPVLWHLSGFAQDLLTGSALALVLVGLQRIGFPARACRWIFAAVVFAITILHLLKSEAVILFGSTLRAEDFDAGPVLTTILRSIRGYSGSLLIGTALLLVLALWIASRASRRFAMSVEGAEGRASATAAFRKAPAFHLVIGAVCAIVLSLPVEVHRGDTAASPLFVLGGLVRDARLASTTASLPTQPPMPAPAVRELAGVTDRQYFSDQYPLAYRPAPRPPDAPAAPRGMRPNIVFFSIENLRAEEVGAYGGTVAGITPNLDRLAAAGIRIRDAFSSGTITPTGELGLLYGLLPLPGTILISNRPETTLTGLPEILRREGWQSFLWMSSTDQTFFLRDRFYDPRGFQMFDGTDFPQDDPRVNWGFSDRVLARRAHQALGKLQEPFAALILTVNNHHPYQLPSDAGPRLEGLPGERAGWTTLGGSSQALGHHISQMLQTIHYSDQALGDFMTAAAREPWFERTIFVITGDHGIPVAPLGRRIETIHQLYRLRHAVPLILYAPWIEGGRVVEGPASHVDMLPTLLGLFGIDSPRTGVGVDLLAGSGEPDRPVASWSEHERMLSISTKQWAYHCTIPVEGLAGEGPIAGELLVDLERDPEGRTNRVGEEAGEAARFRRLARIYGGLYPWIVLSGRSGLPPADASR